MSGYFTKNLIRSSRGVLLAALSAGTKICCRAVCALLPLLFVIGECVPVSANSPLVIQETQLPLSPATRYSVNPDPLQGGTPMPMARAGSLCITSAGYTTALMVAVLSETGEISVYNSAGVLTPALVPGVEELPIKAKQRNANIAMISASANVDSAEYWLAALLTNGQVIYTTNAPAAARQLMDSWQDVCYITSGCAYLTMSTVVALTRNGRTMSTNSALNSLTSGWTGLVDVALPEHMLSKAWMAGLKYDGTVVVTEGALAPAPPSQIKMNRITAINNHDRNPAVAGILEDGSYYCTMAGFTPSIGKLSLIASGNEAVVLTDINGNAQSRPYWEANRTIIGSTPGVSGVLGAFGMLHGDGYVTTDGKLVWGIDGKVYVDKTVEVSLKAVQADPPPGNQYGEAQHVHLYSADAGVAIYYTTDGSDPQTSPSRKLYSNPDGAQDKRIVIGQDTTIRVVAYTADGQQYGGVREFEYGFAWPTIVADPAEGMFCDPFTLNLRLSAPSENAQIKYNLEGAPVTSANLPFPAGGLRIDETTSVSAAVDIGNGVMVNHTTLTYSKVAEAMVVDASTFKLTFNGGETPLWGPGTVLVRASADVRNVTQTAGQTGLVLAVFQGNRMVASNFSFVSIGGAATKNVSTELTLNGRTGSDYHAKAFFVNGFTQLKPTSIILTK